MSQTSNYVARFHGADRTSYPAVDAFPGTSVSASPSLSSHGRWTALQSMADNLVAADTNGKMDVFVFDREAGTMEMVSWAGEP